MAKKNEIKSSIVYIYNSFSDPVFKGTLLLYLKKEGIKKRTEFHLITYEQEEFRFTKIERSAIIEDLKKYNIIWHPLTWHSGKFILIKKFYDFILGILIIAKLKFNDNSKFIVSLGTISGSFAYIFSKIFNLKYYIYQYEPHSEFLVDFGLWSKKSIKNRLLRFLEYKVGMDADFIATGTIHMVKRLEDWNAKSDIYRLPSCVEEDRFRFSQIERENIRKQYSIENQNVILYLGKLGGIYFYDELAIVFRALYEKDNSLFFLIITPNQMKEVETLLTNHGVPKDNFCITKANFSEVPAYISASDIGIVAIPSFPSQKFRSPIKVGEYLCCGIPYIVCQGISEDDTYAKKYNVGVVLEDFTKFEIVKNYSRIKTLLDEDKTIQRARCRKVGIEYRGFSSGLKVSESIFEKLLVH